MQECFDAAIRVVTSPWPEARIDGVLIAYFFVGKGTKMYINVKICIITTNE